MWNIVQNTLTALGINVFHTDVPFNAIWNTDQSVVSIVEGPEFLTSERTEQTSIETTDVVEFTTPNTPLSTFSFGDASATAATTTTTAAEAQTEEEPTATTATADRVGQKRVRQTENSEHTDGANDSSANTGQSENQSTARSLEKRNPKRMKTEETAPISSNQQGQQLAAQGTTGAPVVKEEHTENAYEHNSSVESPSASHKTHPTATDTSGAQLSVQRALNEQPSTSASPLLVRKRARENDNDEIEQPNTESPPEQSSPKRTKTNEVAASSLMHQQQPQTTASLASSSRHQEGQQQPLQQQNRSSVVPSLQHQEPQPRQQRQQQNQTYTRSSSRQQEQQQRQEQQAQAPARVPEGGKSKAFL
ncbi:hypothetical protein BDB00DRAFT_841867 [Zychaea mexicana]|uniref:uncharacterized protein n=1 Tax=Zychaea mexicana TaxID=64656 RepID=UPI0022FE4604|nr:uncharacterized protein BDB00DRAFT_841867 [Zychaea mexicana]KAI9489656.1 hypothetical protein BDB00DRAFT_841867 [Zychaea mexicana]